MRRLGMALLGIALVAVGGCGTPVPPGEVDGVVEVRSDETTTPPPDGSVVVRYELSGTAVTVDGTYSEPSGDAERMVELRQTPLPWDRTFELAPNQFFVAGLIAQGPNLDSTVTCRIIENGRVVAQESGPSVDCRAEVEASG